MKPKFTLLFFKGCPSIAKAESLVNAAGITYKLICQDDLHASDEWLHYSSPTLLYGSQIVFGSKVPPGSKTSSWNLPSLHDLQLQLQRLIQ